MIFSHLEATKLISEVALIGLKICGLWLSTTVAKLFEKEIRMIELVVLKMWPSQVYVSNLCLFVF